VKFVFFYSAVHMEQILFLASLVICIHETVGLCRMDIVPVTLCGCVIWCLTSREEHRLRVCDSMVVMRTFDVRGR